jgi:hypothetical protein
MQQLNEQTKQQGTELATLLSASSGVNGFPLGTTHCNTARDPVIQFNQQSQKLAMDAKFPASLQQQVATDPVKSFFEINKHNIQHTPVMLRRVYKVLQGENGIKGAMTRPEAALCRGPESEARHHRLQPLVHETTQ